MFRFVSCFVLIAVATATYVPSGKGYPNTKVAARKIFHHAPADDEVKSEPEHHHPHHKEEEHDHFVDFYAPINYKFEYGVKDPHTGDHKTHWEERDGEVVRGAYTILDADGSSRLVEYTADPHHGFNAVVKKIEHPHVPVKEHVHEEHKEHHHEPQEHHLFEPQQHQQQHHHHHQHDFHQADEHLQQHQQQQQQHHHQHQQHVVHEHHGYGHGKSFQ